MKRLSAPWLVAGLAGIAVTSLAGCQEAATRLPTGADITTETYEATATVTYTWQVEYARSFDRAQTIRRQKFASTSLVNRDGVEPDLAVTGPDDKGLWWPELPPRPTADELESGKQFTAELRTDPQLLKSVDYAITFDHDGQRRTLPTNERVYRTATKAAASEQTLELTYGPGKEQVIAAAQPIAD
ncbi:hypothetical protein [Pseudanabaena sp. FACHB-2040]|uniref:hypothetical protein n=1 Tax=Pseudanabaena sp. FACHB-2040 TaxID=2692859 RepID=UPI0018EFAD91|nr:hypothetical protein [Pseudanabaena sp. FACHB-2040]